MHKIRFVHAHTALSLALAGLALTHASAAQAQAAQATQEPAASQSETAAPAADASEASILADEIPASLMQMGVGSAYYSPHAFVVDKKARTLTVWVQENAGYRRLAQFPADLGKKDGDKTSSGDHKTPEGIYFLQERLDGPGLDFSQYGKRAFTTDYPNFFDRLERKTGDGIWLHAVPDKVPLTRGSRGCVVVRNEVILGLTQYFRARKTQILIEKEVEYAKVSELQKQTEELNQMLEGWRTAWQNKDIESYISYYGDEFRSQKMDRDAWKQFKQGLNQRYQTLSIKLSKPVLFRYKDRLVARFVQAYSSDQHQDFGEKTLYLRKTQNGYRIIGEEWAKDDSQLARQEVESSTPRGSVTACTTGSDCGTSRSASTN